MIASRHGVAKFFLIALCLANLVFGLLAVCSLWHSLPISVLILCIFIVYLVLGVSFLNLQVFGPAFCHALTTEPVLSLTFDDGPDEQCTPQILSLLKSYGAKATFFCIGKKLEAHPILVRDIIVAGHEIQCHGYEHAILSPCWLPKTYRADLQKSQNAFSQYGQTIRWFRPPFGVVSPRVASEAQNAWFLLCGWSSKANDGVRLVSAKKSIRSLKRGIKSGAILLLHDISHGEKNPVVLTILESILIEMKERGLSSVTISELNRLQ